MSAEPGKTDYFVANILEGVSPRPEPPSALDEVPLALVDLVAQRSSFDPASVDGAWFWTERTVVRVVEPRGRYGVTGYMLPQRFDLKGLEPPVRIEEAEAASHLRLEAGHNDASARAEIAVRQLAIAPSALVRERRVRQNKRSIPKTAAPPAPASALRKKDVAPFEAFQYADGTGLTWPDAAFTKYEPLFDAADLACNGRTWTSLLEALVKREAPKHAKKLHFDPEASTVSVSGPEDALTELARLLRALLKDRASLKKALASPRR